MKGVISSDFLVTKWCQSMSTVMSTSVKSSGGCLELSPSFKAFWGVGVTAQHRDIPSAATRITRNRAELFSTSFYYTSVYPQHANVNQTLAAILSQRAVAARYKLASSILYQWWARLYGKSHKYADILGRLPPVSPRFAPWWHSECSLNYAGVII